ncbi:MAG: LamG domain-containing protein [Candidatus Aenigmarchaeota archaeon]|nr:LamG domain-containing protein [Candidatus Aenigmarchaeota archaeon]
MKGLSPLVSMVLVVAFGFAAMGIVLTVVNPLLDRAKDSGIVNEATQNMQLIDSAVKAVASEAKGSKRTIHVKITEGVLRTNASVDWVYFDYEPRERTVLDGFAGDVKIESRPLFLEYFNRYNTNDNASDVWTSLNGTWTISSGRFLGTGGIAYSSIGNYSSYDLSGTVVPSVATEPPGQVFLIPGDPRNLVMYLAFDGNFNNSVNTTYDYSAYKNNGTMINATAAACFTNNACPTWIGGKFGNATSYDGIGDLTNISGVTQFNSTSFSVALWVNPNSTRVQGIIAKTSVPINQRWRIFMSDTSGNIEFDAQPTDLGNAATTTPIQTETWYFLAGTYDGTNARLYVDGSLIATQAASAMYNNNTNHIEVAPSETARFNGTIDEVMLFNRVLSTDEIQFIYESSFKKVSNMNEQPTIGNKSNATIVLSSPGSNYFDNVKIKSGALKLSFIIPYQSIDIVNQTRFGPGDHNIVIRNYGINTTSNRPIIGIEE